MLCTHEPTICFSGIPRRAVALAHALPVWLHHSGQVGPGLMPLGAQVVPSYPVCPLPDLGEQASRLILCLAGGGGTQGLLSFPHPSRIYSVTCLQKTG